MVNVKRLAELVNESIGSQIEAAIKAAHPGTDGDAGDKRVHALVKEIVHEVTKGYKEEVTACLLRTYEAGDLSDKDIAEITKLLSSKEYKKAIALAESVAEELYPLFSPRVGKALKGRAFAIMRAFV